MSAAPPSKLRNWLQRNPHPAKLRTDGGDTLVVKGRNKWHDALTTLDDLGPSVVEALDHDGNVLRTYRFDDAADEKTRKQEDATVALSRVMMEVADRAAERAIEAADKAAERYAKGYEKAFESMAHITEMNMARLDKLERMYMSLVKRHAETIEDTAEALADAASNEEDGEVKQLVTTLALKSLMGGESKKSNGKGKAKPSEDDG